MEKQGVSRREAIVAGSGLLAAPLMLLAQGQAARDGASAGAASATGISNASGSGAMGPAVQNPLNLYPKPPFKRQHQEAPGLASKMDPKPDHGEQSYKGSGKLTGRKALITGGDSGIGRAAAIAFAREGADVAINYLPVEEPDAKEVVELIQSAGRKAVAIPGDIRDEAFCKKLVNDAAAQLGGLDILVSNAGQQVYKESIQEVTTEQLLSTFHTNVFAMFWIVKAALEHMKPGSSIVITTSIQAYDPSPGILDYAMTKACNMNFIKGLSKQIVPKGIRVNGVAPGPIWTPLQPSGGQSEEKLVKFGEDTPFGRPGQPVELAATYVLLASNDTSYVSGEIHGVTGAHPTA
jgi:NAD(P)-dependent dehydrogenase (short-subunit alcohol dehydrogenase family)